jgi:hypothetical protein
MRVVRTNPLRVVLERLTWAAQPVHRLGASLLHGKWQARIWFLLIFHTLHLDGRARQRAGGEGQRVGGGGEGALGVEERCFCVQWGGRRQESWAARILQLQLVVRHRMLLLLLLVRELRAGKLTMIVRVREHPRRVRSVVPL